MQGKRSYGCLVAHIEHYAVVQSHTVAMPCQLSRRIGALTVECHQGAAAGAKLKIELVEPLHTAVGKQQRALILGIDIAVVG